MDAKQIIRSGLTKARGITRLLLGSLSDRDLLVRPCAGANHIAWQLGHLAVSEWQMIESTFPGRMPALPEGFATKHSKETAGIDDPASFCTKDEYVRVLEAQRQGTLQILDELDPDKLDDPAPESMRRFVANVGELFAMVGSHEWMHMGQYSVVRRKLGAPHAF